MKTTDAWGEKMNTLVLIFNYCLFGFTIIFTFKYLYENFYTRNGYIGAIILIICIIAILSSFTGVKMSNDIVVPAPYIKARYSIEQIIKSDIFALINIGIAFIIIRFNKHREEKKREKHLAKEKRDSERLFSALRNQDDNI